MIDQVPNIVLYYCYTCLKAFFQDSLGKLVQERHDYSVGYFNEARDDGVAVASGGPYVRFAADR